MIHSDEKAMQAAPKEAVGRMTAAYGAHPTALKEAGVYIGGERLHPSATATVVRVMVVTASHYGAAGSRRRCDKVRLVITRPQGPRRRLLDKRPLQNSC